ncbi:MAG: HNH endonuclease [Acidimicrobiia bacterium]|nr:MAG: HNH endonuclease [Acidimicrobiia bacterium]
MFAPVVVPPVDELVATVETAFAELHSRVGEVDVAVAQRLVAQAESLLVHAAGVMERSGEWRREGHASAAALVRARCRMSGGAAATTVKLARVCARMPKLALAFARGDVSRRHVEVVGAAATPERIDALASVDEVVTGAACRVAPLELRGLVQHVTDAIDGDGGAGGAEALHARRRLHVSRTLDGMVAVDGLFDPEAGERLLAALDARMELTRVPGDPRPAPQRRADALVELCETGGAHQATGPGRRATPQMTVVVDLAVLEGRGHLDVVRRARADAAHVGRLPAATLRRLACDAGIARVVVDGASRPLDVGRTTRTVGPALWRALVVRDGGCVHPGCDRPPGWCEAHHVVPWYDGGPTSLDNLELRCRHHHRAVHEGRARDP